MVALKDGQVFRDGPTAEVLTGRVLSDVFGVPVDVDRHTDTYVAFTA